MDKVTYLKVNVSFSKECGMKIKIPIFGWILLLFLTLSSCTQNNEKAKLPPPDSVTQIAEEAKPISPPLPFGLSSGIYGSSQTPVQNNFEMVTFFRQELMDALIVYNFPKSMNLHDTAHIQLLLSINQLGKQLVKKITGPGDINIVRIKTSWSMEARLKGNNTEFQIVAITPKTQDVSLKDFTEWEWDVNALKPGQHILYLTLTALFYVNGHPTHNATRTYNNTIIVYVSPSQRASEFVADNWQWLCAVILVPLGGYLWKKMSIHV